MIAVLLKQRARELGIPFKEAINRTIRAGIGEGTATRPHPVPKTISHSFGSGRVSISTSSSSSRMSWRQRLWWGCLSLGHQRHWRSYLSRDVSHFAMPPPPTPSGIGVVPRRFGGLSARPPGATSQRLVIPGTSDCSVKW
jgi:hypothetical protein